MKYSFERIWRHRTAGIFLTRTDMEEAEKFYEVSKKSLPVAERTYLCASIAAQLRREQNWDEWSRWMTRLSDVDDGEANLHHAYEVGLYALMKWDDEKVLKATEALKSDEPIWMMRRAGLLASLFRNRDAAELYQAALLRVRQKLLADRKSAWLISLEGWASFLHRASYSSLSDDLFAFPERESEETRLRYVAAKVNPWDIISDLEKLTSDRIDRNRADAEKWTLSFKPGRFSPGGVTRLSDDDECPFYSLFDLMDRVGAPDRIATTDVFSSRLGSAYRAKTEHDETDLIAFFARYRGSDRKIFNWMLPRMQVARISGATIDQLISVIPARVERLLKAHDQRASADYLTFILHLLSRIIVRADSRKALQIFEWTVKLLESSPLCYGCYSACEEILEGAIASMEVSERRKAINLALHMKTPAEAGVAASERDWPEIFDLFLKEEVLELTPSANFVSRIDSLIILVRDGAQIDRGRALRRLHLLYGAEKLSPDQALALREAIWSRCEGTGWPSETQLHPWVFLEMPNDGRAEDLFVKRIVAVVAGGKVDYDLLLNLTAGLKKVEHLVTKTMLSDCVRSCLEWKLSSTEGMNSISLALSGIQSRDEATGREIGEALARQLLPKLTAIDISENVALKLQKMDELSHVSSLAATAFQVARIWPNQKKLAYAKLRSAIASRDPMRVYPAFIAMKQFVENASSASPIPSEIKELLLHACEQRTQPGLGSSLDLLGDLVERGLLKEDDLDRLAIALPQVLKEYRYDQRNLEVPSMAELPNVRKNVYRLTKY